MNVLIVESRATLGALWQKHLERQGMDVALVTARDDAIDFLDENTVEIIIPVLILDD